MDYYFSPSRQKTREECEATAAFYCDASTPFLASRHFVEGIEVYHADAQVLDEPERNRHGIVIIRCPHCGASTGVDERLLQLEDQAPGS
jgi:hypothetical protein